MKKIRNCKNEMKYSCRMEGSQPDNSWKIVFNRKCNSITLSITHEKQWS